VPRHPAFRLRSMRATGVGFFKQNRPVRDRPFC
jgi:hypothetical protein